MRIRFRHLSEKRGERRILKCNAYCSRVDKFSEVKRDLFTSFPKGSAGPGFYERAGLARSFHWPPRSLLYSRRSHERPSKLRLLKNDIRGTEN
jgi:hypothetical protein